MHGRGHLRINAGEDFEAAETGIYQFRCNPRPNSRRKDMQVSSRDILAELPQGHIGDRYAIGFFCPPLTFLLLILFGSRFPA